MGALSGVTVHDLAISVGDTLVVADLHVGRGAASNVELPVGEGEEMVERFESLCADLDPEEVVVAGDLLHSFETVPGPVRDTLSGLRRAARDVGARIVVTPGNHDTLLDAVWSGPVEEEYRLGDTVVCHGHVEPEAEADRYIVGHDHPTIDIEGRRRACVLAGEEIYRGADLVMLPSFNKLVRGVRINDMSAADFMSPLVTDADALAPVVRDADAGETLTFPTLGAFRHRL
ncbi:metallophosphoesterase [Halovenus sp. WSH3]|uniref:Metallophosphoesterase n=1 Tax=Halovenus carboxidivorans TaxID=2692199 RepID=A0A6B0TC57_9EURY|nr:metallophosphoesterase [Halovenus carboxidivorans]MXR52490.1 metallophosphoesterase [Halovenus carboxidivorans]